MLVLAFALMQWSLPDGLVRVPGMNRFETALYQSGVTFFTLGYGDVTPHTRITRFIAVLEAGVGFGFLAVVIGYLPVLYQAFFHAASPLSPCWMPAPRRRPRRRSYCAATAKAAA